MFLFFKSRLGLLGAVGIVLFVVFNFFAGQQSDAESKTQTVIEKSEAVRTARAFAENELGLQADAWKPSVSYVGDVEAIGYLQKTKTASDFEEKYGGKIPLEAYRVELRDPNSNMRVKAEVNITHNRVGSFDFEAPAKNLNGMTDMSIFKDYVLKRFGIGPDALAETASKNKLLPFALVTKEPLAGEAYARFEGDVQNGRVAALHISFQLPESYLSLIHKQDALGATLSSIHLWATALMAVGALVYLFIGLHSNQWKRGILLTLVFLAIYTWTNINMYPAFRTVAAEQGANVSPEVGAIGVIIFMEIIVLLYTAALYFSFVSGEKMWRRAGHSLWPSLKDPLFSGTVKDAVRKGYALCFIIIGFQSVIYFIGDNAFGVWTTVDPLSSPYNMMYPILFPVMAWVAAIQEEGVYRLFGIAFFQKVLRSRFLAVLVSSIIWALGHTQYPIYPSYTRLIEVGLLGIIFGYAFLRYGFLTAVFAHAAMDSILMGLSVLSIGGTANAFACVFYIACPAIIGWFIARLRKQKPISPAG